MNIIFNLILPFFVTVFCSFINSVEATEGLVGYWDSSWFRVPTCKCFQNILSAKFVIIHAISRDDVNNSDLNLIHARLAGFDVIDIYVVPCNTCITNLFLVENIISTFKYLKEYYAKFNRVWLHIFGSHGWSGDEVQNVESIEKTINTLKERDLKYGIYTDRVSWVYVTGNTTKFSDVPLLYINEDGKNNFDDFYQKPFGGWKKPTMKRYDCRGSCVSTGTLCLVWKP
ncbi:hypothetical protein ACQ4LE_010534 [Meloidogyne hapla]